MYTFSVVVLFVVAGVQAVPIKKYGPVPNTPENIALIASGNHRQKTEELSGQFEGDIILNDVQRTFIEAQINGQSRTGLVNLTARWPDKIVPIEFSDDLDAEHRTLVESSLRVIEAAAPCVRFVPYVDQKDFVRVHGKPTGCWSMVGRQGGIQPLNLQLRGCMYERTIVHEFLHALGFYHMQSSFERDAHIRIGWEHIIPGMEHNFNMYTSDTITNFGQEYDIKSIMHYSAYGFTKDGFATMIPNVSVKVVEENVNVNLCLFPTQDISEINRIGYYPTMSTLDIKRLNAMYCDV